MENEATTLNTESNDIAGNRVDGPVGNTAAKLGQPGAGVGLPGGPPAPAVAPDISNPAALVSSESLAASETSAGQGGVGSDAQPQENKEVPPANLELLASAANGGNFDNSTQGSYHDQDRRDNQDSDANRGEFGAQDVGGTTHGGFGNQNRLADYEPRDSAEDGYYGGAGRPGLQDNAYRAYDGRNERPDSRREYGFERGVNSVGPADSAVAAGQARDGNFSGPGADNRDQPARADPNSAHQNDNGAAAGPDRGYAPDYGHTSLRPAAGAVPRNDPAGPARRNQTEDYQPAQAGVDGSGPREEGYLGYSTNTPELADGGAPRPSSSQGPGDLGQEAPRSVPDFHTGADRSGHVQDGAGDAAQGLGSRGGSYNDAYDDSKPGSTAGSPAKGDQRREDLDPNYGAAARKENRPAADDDQDDHGTPHRNTGREGTADE